MPAGGQEAPVWTGPGSCRNTHALKTFVCIIDAGRQKLTSRMAKAVRWLQLQVVSSGVALTRKQPAELQPPRPPGEKDKNMNARRHFGSGLKTICSSPFREKSQNAQEATC